jgi:protein-S-isoprenylcysteine O-methyltransferase Ste14
MYIRPPLLAVLCGLAVLLWDAIHRYLAVRFNGQLLVAGLLGAAALALIIAAIRGYYPTTRASQPSQKAHGNQLFNGPLYRRMRNPVYPGTATFLLGFGVTFEV